MTIREMLDDALERAWQMLSKTYEVNAKLPKRRRYLPERHYQSGTGGGSGFGEHDYEIMGSVRPLLALVSDECSPMG
jgi:hypothetical protein